MGGDFLHFGECARVIRDSVNPETIDPNTPYIGLQHIAQDELRLLNFGKAKDVASNKYLFKKGDILFGKLRPYFRKVIIAPFDGVCSTDIWVVRSTEKCDQNYLYFWMASQNFVDKAYQGSEGTKMPRAKWGFVSNIVKEVPDKEEQIRLGCFLKAFNDKIDINQHINQTLAEITQAVFSSWFINFDPVRAKITGASYPLPDDIMALFPDELVESEMGMIPKGWTTSKLENITKITDCLHSKKPIRLKEGKILLQVYNIGFNGNLDLSDQYFISNEDYNIWIRRFEVSPGDIIISKTGRVGAVAHIPKEFRGALGRNLVGIRANKQKINESYLRDLMLSQFMEDEIRRKTSLGTILRSIHVKHISQLRVILPEKQIMTHYQSYIHRIHSKTNQNINEARILAKQRDSLLIELFKI